MYFVIAIMISYMLFECFEKKKDEGDQTMPRIQTKLKNCIKYNKSC